MSKLKLFGPHYRMERFSVMFCALLAGLFLTTVACFGAHVESQNTTLDEKALYTQQFETSKTGVTGSVDAVYTSKDKTKSFLLLKFDDTKTISMDAKNYQMFLTGASVSRNKQTLSGSPSGSVYVFGNTGYMGVYLVNESGFTPQILDLVVRCNSELKQKSDSTSEENKEAASDASFSKYDQFRVYYNPGGAKASHLDCLDKGKAPSVSDFYNEAIVAPEEKSIHDELKDEVNQMAVSLNQIDEYTQRLKTDDVTVPDEPEAIRGDKVKKNDDGSYTYEPATVLPGGYDLDWQHRSVTQGFIKDLIKKTDTPNMTVDQYFAMQTKAQNGDASSNEFDTNIDWQLNDGTLIESLSGNSTRYTKYTEECSDLTGAWRDYYSEKSTYQRTTLQKLLDLETSTDGILTSSTVNTSKGALTCY